MYLGERSNPGSNKHLRYVCNRDELSQPETVQQFVKIRQHRATSVRFLSENSLLEVRDVSNKQLQTDDDDELSDSIPNGGTKA